MAGAGENIEHSSCRLLVVGHAVGGHERQSQGPGRMDNFLVQPLLPAQQMPLNFQKHVARTEGGHQSFQPPAGPLPALENSLRIPGQRDQSTGKFRQIVPANRGLRFGAAKFGGGDELAEVAIAAAGFHDDGQHAAVLHGEFRSDNGLETRLPRGGMQPGRAVETIAIEQGQAGQLQFRRAAGQHFRLGRSAQKAERAAGVEFNIVHTRPPLSTPRRPATDAP